METLVNRENTTKKTGAGFVPVSSITLLTVLFLLVSSSFTHAQFLICDGAKGPNLFTNYNNGTFGQGVPQNKGPLGGATTYTYIPISCGSPSDGYYSVSNSTDCGSGGKVFGTWDVIGDHTGAANPILGNPPPAPGTSAGYMMVVNASVGKDIAVADSIRNLCPNQLYEFQAWIRSLNPPGILPNLMFMINGVDTYPTGNITDKTWKNIGFTFTVPAGQKAIKVAIRNNAPGGDGNDWVLDDISVNTCNTKIRINADSVIRVCEGTTVTLKDTVVSTTGTPFPYYKWQKSTDNGVNWTDLTGVITETANPKNYVTTLPSFVATLSMNNYLFRLVVATDADVLIKNDVCYYSAVKTTRLIVNPNPVLKVASANICAGDTATLTVSGADIFKWTPAATLSKDTGKTVKAFPLTTTTYTITAKTFAGCPATTTVTVTVKPIVADAGPDVTICWGSSTQLNASGGTKYFWSPGKGLSDSTIFNPVANVKSTITYTVTVTSGSCIDKDEVTVTVVPPIVLSITASAPRCFNGNDGKAVVTASGGGGTYSYVWSPIPGNGSSVNGTPGKYTVIVTDQFGCMDTASIVIPNTKPISGLISVKTSNCNKPDGSATIDTVWGGTPPYSYSWNTTPVQTTQTASNIVAGSYNIVITDANGCTATLTALVPNTPGINSNATITNVSCFGGNDGSAKATGSDGVAPYSYVWSNNQNTDIAKNLVAGTYTVIVTDARGCPAITIVTITQPTKVHITSKDTSICPNAFATLHAKGEGGTGAISFTWKPGGAAGASISVNPASTTTYTITGTDQKGCTDSTTVTVKLNAIPVITASGDTICFGKSTTLNAGGASTYTWAPTTGLSSATGSKVIANPANTTTYTITGTDNNNCVGNTTIVVAIKPAPVVTATGGNACPGDTMKLTANGALTYTWSPARGLSTTTGAVVISSPDQTTTYTITGTGTNGCTSTATATATINPEPVAAIIANPNSTLIFYPTIYFTDNTVGGAVKWNWSFGDPKKSTSIKQHPSFTYPDTIGTYTVRLIVVNQFGCIDTAWTVVEVKGQYSFYIANTFTPNGDGINDGFAPKGTGIDESDFGFWIFDRWGNLIWKSHTWGEHWNGRANQGEDIAQIDTYVWKVRVKELDTHLVHTYIGHVNIVK
jgi:gliding motility-associated-like protein